MNKKVSFGLVIGLLATTVVGGQSASAVESQHTIQVVRDAVPGLDLRAPVRGSLDLHESSRSMKGDSIQLVSKSGYVEESLTFSIDYVNEVTSMDAGSIALSGDDPSVSALADGTPNGFQVFTTLNSAPKSKRFDYTFDVPANTVLIETPEGFLMQVGERVIGSIDLPWAVDSNGRQLKTHFEWKNRVLTQVLDEKVSQLSYPVVLDPAWGYIQQYNLTYSPAANFAKLQTCFNCYFPVAGAPRKYPTYGQLLPLRVLEVGNLECTMGPPFTGMDYRAFQFYAPKNHVDGYGSNITFQFVKVGTQSKLVVDAYVVNHFFIVGQYFYVSMAGLQWQLFANNLNSSTPRT